MEQYIFVAFNFVGFFNIMYLLGKLRNPSQSQSKSYQVYNLDDKDLVLNLAIKACSGTVFNPSVYQAVL